MGRLLRTLVITAFTVTLLSSIPCRAATEEILADANAIAQMEARALQAKPREQCFLYTELVHAMTELAGHQMLAGDPESAAVTLQRVHHYAELIHLGLANDTKRLMNAQMLMHHTTRRLDEYVQHASFEDRESLQATLKQLTQVENELLNQVFAH
ncbi:hypothetical protein [Granulicella arctica]|uniref:hypothetical protein n=1 Tax=Granulicella arctica TaxID=940613 RepID=UPI0021E0D372|nr:hypothetical protein [Granulicella arctica]